MVETFVGIIFLFVFVLAVTVFLYVLWLVIDEDYGDGRDDDGRN